MGSVWPTKAKWAHVLFRGKIQKKQPLRFAWTVFVQQLLLFRFPYMTKMNFNLSAKMQTTVLFSFRTLFQLMLVLRENSILQRPVHACCFVSSGGTVHWILRPLLAPTELHPPADCTTAWALHCELHCIEKRPMLQFITCNSCWSSEWFRLNHLCCQWMFPLLPELLSVNLSVSPLQKCKATKAKVLGFASNNLVLVFRFRAGEGAPYARRQSASNQTSVAHASSRDLSTAILWCHQALKTWDDVTAVKLWHHKV